MAYTAIREVQSGLSGAATFVYSSSFLNWSFGSVQIVYKSFNASNAVIQLEATNDQVNYPVLTPYVSTLTSAGTDQVMWNIPKIGYDAIRISYAPGSNTTGSYSIFLVKKGGF